MQQVKVCYDMYDRDGTSISPFVGTKFKLDKQYFIIPINEHSVNKKTKQKIINHTFNRTARQQQGIGTGEIHETTMNQTQPTTTRNEETENNPSLQNESTDMSKQPRMMTVEEAQRGLQWHQMYYNLEESIPKYKAQNKKKLTEVMNCAIKDGVLPLLKKIASKDVPPEYPAKEVINWYLCYGFHIIVENAKRALGILNKNSIKKCTNLFDEEIGKKKRARDAGESLMNDIETIKQFREQDLTHEVLSNREEEIYEDAMDAVERLSEQMKIGIFNEKIVAREVLIKTIDDIISQRNQTNILTYIQHADNDINIMPEHHKDVIAKKARELFRLCPSRAMRYYVDTQVSPGCKIPLNLIRDELANRWREESFNSDEENEEWVTTHKLLNDDNKLIVEMMQKKRDI